MAITRRDFMGLVAGGAAAAALPVPLGAVADVMARRIVAVDLARQPDFGSMVICGVNQDGLEIMEVIEFTGYAPDSIVRRFREIDRLVVVGDDDDDEFGTIQVNYARA